MRPTIETYVRFAMYEMKLRFSLDETIEAYRNVVREMIEAQEYQIGCHQDGSYGKPPNQEKIDEIVQDIKLLKSYLESK